jgi:nucleotide-binding universal stress UspA family protein
MEKSDASREVRHFWNTPSHTRRRCGPSINPVEPEGATRMDVREILVPVDYSRDSQQALWWGMSLAGKYGSRLLLFHVIPKAVDEVFAPGIAVTSPPAYYLERMAPGNRPFPGQTLIIDLIDKALTELQDFAQKHLKEPVPLECKVGVGKPAEEILRVAREGGIDLIVMGTHGHTGLRHLLLGSVAEEVTRHAPCPVFTIRRQGEANA